MQNNMCNNRYAIILSAKNTPWSVHRNFFRRTFYDVVNNTNSWYTSYDIVFSPRKGKFFDKTIETHTIEFVREIEFLLKKIS